MNNSQEIKKGILFVFVFFFALTITLFDAAIVFSADEGEEVSTQLEDKVENMQEDLGTKLETPDEFIELLKQRALARIKKKKKSQILKFNVSASVAGGYESNILVDSAHKGDVFTNQYAMVQWIPTFNKYVGLNTTYVAYNQIYSDYTDYNYLYNILDVAVRFSLLSEGKLRLEPGIGYINLLFPLSANSSYAGIKYFLNTKSFFSRDLTGELKFEYKALEYTDKKARNPSQVIQDFVREDERYTIEVGIIQRVGKFYLSLKEKVYRNTSNDLYEDLNDYYAFKTSFSISASFLEDNQLKLKFTPSIERKNYRERLAVDTARYDDKHSYKFTASYAVSKDYKLNYALRHSSINSNNKIAEYTNVIHEIGVSARF